MIRNLIAPAILAGLIFGGFFGWHIGMSMAQPVPPTDVRAANLEAQCSYVARAGARAFDAATHALWKQHGPTGLPLEFVDTEAFTAGRN